MEQTANPSIITNPIPSQTVSEIQKNPGGWFKKNIVKIIIVLLIAAVVGELIFGGLTLFSPSASRNLNILSPGINNLTDASLSLTADKDSYKKGETVVIDVKLFTGGQTTDSTDMVLKYDPDFLEPNKEFVKAGQIYSEYPPLQLDKEQGLVGISGITVPGKNAFSGVGSFVKLNFTALQDGQTKVTIDFKEGETADSNVVLSGSSTDILGSVTEADVVISETAGSSDGAEKGQKCESFSQECQDSNGNKGSQTCTGGSLKGLICSYDPMYTVSCSECKT